MNLLKECQWNRFPCWFNFVSMAWRSYQHGLERIRKGIWHIIDEKFKYFCCSCLCNVNVRTYFFLFFSVCEYLELPNEPGHHNNHHGCKWQPKKSIVYCSIQWSISLVSPKSWGNPAILKQAGSSRYGKEDPGYLRRFFSNF